MSDDLKELLTKIPLFADIKPKMLDAAAESVAFRRAVPGDALVAQDAYTDELFVVLSGVATAYRTEAAGVVENLGSHGVEDWFGELTALANQAQPFTVKAETDMRLMVIDAPLFKKLYTGGGSFRKLVDERYQERALSIHLKTAPALREFGRDYLKKLARFSKLITIDEKKVIAKAGEEADGVYMVRSGIVLEEEEVDGVTKTKSFLRENSTFGEQSLLGEWNWPLTLRAMTRVDIVHVPAAEVHLMLQDDPHARAQLQSRVQDLEGYRLGSTSLIQIADLGTSSELDVKVGKEALKGGEALLIDLNRCTRCNACVEACVSVHDDRVPRLSKRGIKMGSAMLTSACYNCTIPECMMGCNYGAIRRDVNGAIHIIKANCTGCSACEIKCPYGVIRMASLMTPETEAEEHKSFFSRMFPVVFGRRRTEPVEALRDEVEEESSPKKKEVKTAIKCDLCAGFPFEACVYNCPCNAISRVDPAKLTGTRS